MAEYIEREDVKRLINNNFSGLLIAIDSIPTADVVPVVRCKDCRDYDMASGFCQCHSQCYDSSMSWDVFREDDFCSYGERKERISND